MTRIIVAGGNRKNGSRIVALSMNYPGLQLAALLREKDMLQQEKTSGSCLAAGSVTYHSSTISRRL